WNGATAFSANHHEADFAISAPAEPGAYWVEIRPERGSTPLAWLRSNPIYVRSGEPSAPADAPAPVAAARPIAGTAPEPAWRVEHDPTSAAAVDAVNGGGGEVRFRFGLAGGSPVGQYSALVHDLTPDFVADRVTFTARAERPMRISVQLRGGDGVV